MTERAGEHEDEPVEGAPAIDELPEHDGLRPEHLRPEPRGELLEKGKRDGQQDSE